MSSGLIIRLPYRPEAGGADAASAGQQIRSAPLSVFIIVDDLALRQPLLLCVQGRSQRKTLPREFRKIMIDRAQVQIQGFGIP